MPSLLTFLIRRIIAIPVTLLIITLALYGMVMLASPEERAALYYPPRTRPFMPERMVEAIERETIERYGLRDPFPQQYARWIGNLLRGNWGWSPVLNGDVLEALVRRAPVTVELTFYSLLLLIPTGLASGVMAGWRENSVRDHRFRLAAFVATAIPPFVLALFLLSIFYVGLGWFRPGFSPTLDAKLMTTPDFNYFTRLLTIDGLLNARLDITAEAFRGLVLPVFTLCLAHWATLGRITRAAVIEVKEQDYIVAARSRGLSPRSIIWGHAFRNAALPGLTSSALSAASLVTGVYVVEVVFGYHGLSELIVSSATGTPDATLVMGFAIFSVLLVLPIMLILDLFKAIVDPRLREGEIE